MSCFFLKQLDAKSVEDNVLLDLFQHCREQVVRVASTHHLPNHIAVTTQNGFIEFVDVCNGEFRLFLTHLEHHIPLESPVRCISLIHSYFPTHTDSSISDFGSRGTHLLYSLAFSNELLLANLGTGMVRVLDRFNTRPSALFCDENYIVCGEGGGQVSVWGLNHEGLIQGSVATHPKRLWKKLLLEDTVVCLRVHHEQLICCSADHHFCVLLVDTGECLMTWMSELDPVVDVLFFESIIPQHLTTVFCFSTCISIYTETELASSNLTTCERTIQQSQNKWRLNRRFTLDNAIQCATCFANYLVAGTASGVVLLYYFANLEDGLKELARFDVGYGVIRVQLYANETLLVVSSRGDIWKWPLADLISECDKGNMLRESQALSRQGQDDLLKPANVSAVLNSRLADESQNTFSDCAETLPGEGCRESSVHLEDDCKSQDSYCEGTQEGSERQWQPSMPSAPTTESLPVRQSEMSRIDDEISEMGHPTVSQTTLSPSVQNLQYISTATGTKTQPCVIVPPLERTSDDEELVALVEVKLQDLKNVVKLASSLTPSIASEEDDSSADERNGMHQESPEAVISCLSSRGTSDFHESDGERDDNVGSISVASEPEVVAVEEESPLENSTESISSSLSPRSARPPEPIPEGKTTDEEHTVAFTASQPLEGQISISQKGPTAQEYVTNKISGDHDIIPQSNAMVQIADNKTLTHARSEYSPERELRNLQEMLGPPVVISGLRKGRLMDPRKVYQILKNQNVDEESGDVPYDEVSDSNLESTAVILEQQDDLRKSTFSLERYVKDHSLEAEALPYHHPVRLPNYSLSDRVFGDAMPPILDGSGAFTLKIKNDGHTKGTTVVNMVDAGSPSAKPAAGAVEFTDDLIDATCHRFTRKKDPELIEERRRGKPDINAHPCEDILYPANDPTSTVLFKEYPIQLSEPYTLLLPMPLPPTPSVF